MKLGERLPNKQALTEYHQPKGGYRMSEMYTFDSKEVASWHLLQLAEQGRAEETVAQFLASMYITGEHEPAEILDNIATILDRTQQLMEHQNEVWPGLLAGPPTYIETHDRLTNGLMATYDKMHGDAADETVDGEFSYRMSWMTGDPTARPDEAHCEWEEVIYLESDLNIARWVEDESLARRGPVDFVLLTGSDRRLLLYTKPMMKLIIALEEADEQLGRVLGEGPQFSESFQAIHEMAIHAGEAWLARDKDGD